MYHPARCNARQAVSQFALTNLHTKTERPTVYDTVKYAPKPSQKAWTKSRAPVTRLLHLRIWLIVKVQTPRRYEKPCTRLLPGHLKSAVKLHRTDLCTVTGHRTLHCFTRVRSFCYFRTFFLLLYTRSYVGNLQCFFFLSEQTMRLLLGWISFVGLSNGRKEHRKMCI